MSEPAAALNPSDKVCWVRSSPRSARTMSLRRCEGVLVRHKERGLSDVKLRNGHVIEVQTDRLLHIDANPLHTFTTQLLAYHEEKNKLRADNGS